MNLFFTSIISFTFAFQAEGQLQAFFPALLLREMGTIPDAAS